MRVCRRGNYALTRRLGQPSGKTRAGQVEASPEEMHRAAFADEAGAEFLQDHAGGKQNPPEAPCERGIVRAMPLVPLEWDGLGDFLRFGIDGAVDTEPVQRLHQAVVKGRDGARLQRLHLEAAIAGPNLELVLQKIELDF